MEKISAEEWWVLAQQLHQLMGQEMKNADQDRVRLSYPSFVVMYEFFRMVRGESFFAQRSEGIVEFQSRLYAMEDELLVSLKECESKLDMSDPQVKHRFAIMEKAVQII